MPEGTPIIIKKKKVSGGHGHHGGSWKVAYADFVTAMMAFFMVMWIMGLSDSTKAQIQGYFNDPLGIHKQMPMSKDIISWKDSHNTSMGHGDGQGSNTVREDQNELKQLKKKIEKTLQEAANTGTGSATDLKDLIKKVDVQLTDEGLRVEFSEAAGAVFFESGKAVIRPEARKLIADIAPALAKSGRIMDIEGHTDAKAYSGNGYDNYDLSADRARALYHALLQGGVETKQLDEIRGCAATRLKDPEHPYAFSNRRVTLLMPFGKRVNGSIDLPRESFKKEIQGVFKPASELNLGEVDLKGQAEEEQARQDQIRTRG